ncbi:MAG: hypothetical protein WD178_00555 [Actinomycetota bacterium]
MPKWETFRGRGASVVKKPYITFQKSGSLALSKPAYEMLGRPTHAELLYDPEERIIGVRAVPAGVDHAYPLRHTETNPNQYLISGVAFLKYYDLEVKVSRRYPAYLDEGVLCVDLKTQGTKIVGNRNGQKNGHPAPEEQPTLG